MHRYGHYAGVMTIHMLYILANRMEHNTNNTIPNPGGLNFFVPFVIVILSLFLGFFEFLYFFFLVGRECVRQFTQKPPVKYSQNFKGIMNRKPRHISHMFH